MLINCYVQYAFCFLSLDLKNLVPASYDVTTIKMFFLLWFPRLI